MNFRPEFFKDYEEGNYELDPYCFKEKIAFAVTNRGELIPCCMCDDPITTEDPEFKKLTAVSKISEFESTQEILKQKEWKDFYNNLKNNKGPFACFLMCRKKRTEKDAQVTKIMYPKTGKVIGRLIR